MNKQNRDLQAIFGHFIDLYKLSSLKIFPPHSYTKFRVLNTVRKQVNAQTFIETGTYLGVTTRRCAPLFHKIYTIELDSALAEQASIFLSSRKNIEVLQGDALDILPKILNNDINDTLVFLDGHFSGGVTACGSMPEPAIEEIKILAQFKEKIAAIVIDDFRLFGTEAGFPSKSSLFQTIEEYLPGFTVAVSFDQVIITRTNPLAAKD